jgi:hypothetical protein
LQAFGSATPPTFPAGVLAASRLVMRPETVSVSLIVPPTGAGGGGPLSVTVTGLPEDPSFYSAAVYVRNGCWFGSKPVPPAVYPVTGTSFTISGWASDPADLTVPRIGVWIIPSTFVPPTASGGAGCLTTSPCLLRAGSVGFSIVTRDASPSPAP